MVKSSQKEEGMKFMQSLAPKIYSELRKIAKERGITVQELLRSVVIPEWKNRQKILKEAPEIVA